ncbi:SET and MYND domain-containing protein DDB_G0273589-like [Contarinia nasturtii]|uniref:SET and MYND domain-containing protein DDB_G0273589-like n=1 Tax=Contarinia nasturtii TaxID=265458 RepID=UPI0012D46D79|nr:SET and MYND domain-containing protein DDB_G0273589-like [Contarinia nasturtii]XP_031625495.1 SET and MYND domain-containing protein DDB_G0273589-like [Contarinia nasturtii]
MLWKKESSESGERFVDLFESIDEKGRQAVDRLILDEMKVYETCKGNIVSNEWRRLGTECFHSENWLQALTYYNRSLRHAEVGSESVALAYTNRSACFFQLKRYKEAITDIELALGSANLPAKWIPILKARKKKCHQILSNLIQLKKNEPKLSYKSNKNHPYIANVLKIRYTDKDDNHLVATRDIPVGKTVLLEEDYLSSYKWEHACETCWVPGEKTSLIPCNECALVTFCSTKCQKMNRTHKLECGSVLNAEHATTNRLIIQSILRAIATFHNIKSLMEFVGKILLEVSKKLPDSTLDEKSMYHCFFKLERDNVLHDEQLPTIYQLYRFIMKMPKVNVMFETEEKRRFLMHLVAHHFNIVMEHSYDLRHGKVLPLFTSRLGHSCAANLMLIIGNDYQFCITCRPVKKGEMLCYSYLPITMPMEKRHAALKLGFKITCKCDDCVLPTLPIDSELITLDTDYRFIMKNYTSNVYCPVERECIEFLNKFGHLWSSEIRSIYIIYLTTTYSLHSAKY